MSTKRQGLSAAEKAAMKERVAEIRAEERVSKNRAEGEKAIREKIAEMSEPDRSIAEKIHAIVTKSAPDLMPRTWYGMPAYASKDGKVVCYYTAAEKFESRYATFGFNDTANLDDGVMWPTSFALKKLTAAEEARISELVQKAVS
jgi:uncharacterized protein YdhG (YjbR/CyaY superfamily)